MSFLNTPIPRRVIAIGIACLVLMIFFFTFLPTEEAVYWHFTSPTNVIRCSTFDVSIKLSWMSDWNGNCSAGIKLLKHPYSLIQTPSSWAHASLIVMSKADMDLLPVSEFENRFRMLAGLSPDTPLSFTDKYARLGKCLVAQDRASPREIIMWCRNADASFDTLYGGDAQSVSDLTEMLKLKK